MLPRIFAGWGGGGGGGGAEGFLFLPKGFDYHLHGIMRSEEHLITVVIFIIFIVDIVMFFIYFLLSS